MRTKEKDILYCGVQKDEIKKAKPKIHRENFDLFMKFVSERYRIHIQKDILHKEPPWTDDPVLSKYRFTNVRREHDRETKWLIHYIAENSWLTYRQKIFNIILFRMYNKHETLEIMGAPFNIESIWHCTEPIKRLKNHQKEDKDFVFFTAAFITGGLKLALKTEFPSRKDFVPGLPLYKLKQLNEHGFYVKLTMCRNQNEVYQLLRSINGIGDFLAYQIFVDFTYIKEFPFSENEFTVAGPGCRKGLDMLFTDKDGMTYEECLFWLRNNWYRFKNHKLFFDPEKEMLDLKHYDRVMNVMSLENCFCELSKYIRAYNNTGRPRNKYKPRKDDD